MTRGAKKKESLNFEASLKKLEAIVRRLEDEEATLEESLKLFAEGKHLARLCEAELQEAENRVRQLIENDKGEIEETEFEADANGGEAESPSESDIPPEPSKSAAPPRKPETRDDLPF